MLKRFGIPALALASALAVAAPNVTLAAERGGEREGHEAARQDFRGRGGDGSDRDRHFDRDNRGFDRDDYGRFNFGVGVYAAPAPAPAASGYYDQYGVWHASGYYDQFGVWHPYGY
ncbi:MAG TPA: hypothetical protein VKX49_18645 [Bryobacteraceae bacterium]|nr:hypothetical protein [Bryobacteraceae bacterium]